MRGYRRKKLVPEWRLEKQEGVGRSRIPDQRRGFQCEDTVAALWDEKMGSRESGNRGVCLLAFRTKAGSCSVAVGTGKWRFVHMNPTF